MVLVSKLEHGYIIPLMSMLHLFFEKSDKTRGAEEQL
jgi:hypothetical protein